jgi:type IV pilus assembly protein PilC
MPTFKYKALKKGESESYEGKVEAKDRFEIYGIVRKEGAQVLSVTEVTGSDAFMNKLNTMVSRVSMSEKIIFFRNLGAMIKAGLPLSRALNVMERQTKKIKYKEVLSDVQSEIQKGGDLNAALNKHPDTFSPLMVAMIKAGEESGSLTESCIIIANQTERSYELKKKIRGAMIYPSVILTVLIAIGILMMLYIVPSLASTFSTMGSELPTSTKTIIFISDFLVNYTIPTIATMIAIVALFIAFVRTPNGKRLVESIVLPLPVIGTLVKETNSARTGRTLSSLLGSGVHVLQAMEITEEVIQNTHFKEIILQARDQVQAGAPIADIFVENEKLYPPLVGELIAVGEETGNLPDMLIQIAEFYESEVDQKTKNMSTIIEPVLMLVVGIAVGYFALAMISPIYTVVENF